MFSVLYYDKYFCTWIFTLIPDELLRSEPSNCTWEWKYEQQGLAQACGACALTSLFSAKLTSNALLLDLSVCDIFHIKKCSERFFYSALITLKLCFGEDLVNIRFDF